MYVFIPDNVPDLSHRDAFAFYFSLFSKSLTCTTPKTPTTMTAPVGIKSSPVQTHQQTEAEMETKLPAWAVPEIMTLLKTTKATDNAKISSIRVTTDMTRGEQVQVAIETTTTVQTNQLSPTGSATWYMEKDMAKLFEQPSPIMHFLDNEPPN